jgi:hypothetical protein
MPTRYVVYEQDDGPLLTTEENAEHLLKQGVILPEDQLLYEFDAHSPEEACSIHHLRKGSEPYRPEGEPKPCPWCGSVYYSESSGVCWRCGKIG